MPDYRPPMQREDLLYVFWNYSDFKELREGMMAYARKHADTDNEVALRGGVEAAVYRTCMDAYRILDRYGPSDCAQLLSSSYVQRQFEAVMLTEDGRTVSEIKREAAQAQEEKRKEKIKKKFLICVCIGLVLGAIELIWMLVNSVGN